MTQDELYSRLLTMSFRTAKDITLFADALLEAKRVTDYDAEAIAAEKLAAVLLQPTLGPNEDEEPLDGRTTRTLRRRLPATE